MGSFLGLFEWMVGEREFFIVFLACLTVALTSSFSLEERDTLDVPRSFSNRDP